MLKTRADRGTCNPPHENMVLKYGIERTREMKSLSKIGNTHGAGNKGKPKTEEHRKKISESVKAHFLQSPESRSKAGRKSITNPGELVRLVEELGYDGAAEKLGITPTQCRYRFYYAKGKLAGN